MSGVIIQMMYAKLHKTGVTLLIKCNSVWIAHITAYYVLLVLQTLLIFRMRSLSRSLNKFQEITPVTYYDPQYPLVLANNHGDFVGEKLLWIWNLCCWQIWGLTGAQGHRFAVERAGS